MADGDEPFWIVVAVGICSCYIVAPVHVNKRLSNNRLTQRGHSAIQSLVEAMKRNMGSVVLADNMHRRAHAPGAYMQNSGQCKIAACKTAVAKQR
jgi:hypothetical protein